MHTNHRERFLFSGITKHFSKFMSILLISPRVNKELVVYFLMGATSVINSGSCQKKPPDPHLCWDTEKTLETSSKLSGWNVAKMGKPSQTLKTFRYRTLALKSQPNPNKAILGAPQPFFLLQKYFIPRKGSVIFRLVKWVWLSAIPAGQCRYLENSLPIWGFSLLKYSDIGT